MASVETLLNTIKDLSLVGSGDATDDARIMRYMNLVYAEVYRVTAKMRPTVLLTSENVSITSGAGTMSVAPFAVTMVKDTGNDNKPLEVTTLPELEEEYPGLDDTGDPSKYYFTSATAINTYPANSTTVKVRYVPGVTTLASSDAESAIKIPPEFHDLLIWGTLMYMNVDERDKAVGPEVATAGTRYTITLGDYKAWLLSGQPVPTTRTKVVMG